MVWIRYPRPMVWRVSRWGGALLGLARIHMEAGQLDRAEALLHKSRANFPHDDEAAELLAEIDRLRRAR